MAYDLARLRQMSGQVSIVGIGETDYGADYRAARAAREQGLAAVPGELDSYGLAALAFKRALADSGLKKSDIDGVGTGGPIHNENTCEMLGLTPTWGSMLQGTTADFLIPLAVQAIYSGYCDTVALIYGNAQRSMGTQYGGVRNAASRLSEYYYHPWGWSSPGAHYAMMWQTYMDTYGAKEEDLGIVPVTLRKHAMLNENAVMRMPLTIDDYMNSRYICRPFHLFDYCLVNDGAVALILRRTDMSKDLPHNPVQIAGFSWDTLKDNSQLRDRIYDLYYSSLKKAGDDCFAMSGMKAEDVDHFQTYDAFSVHLPLNLEGFGFCKRGEVFDFMKDGNIEIGGSLPCDTSGGMMSESYMQSWNHQVEAVRQLRHEAGARQVKGVETSMYCHHGGEGTHPIMYRRG